MKITTRHEALSGEPSAHAEHFTGPVTQLPLHAAVAPHRVRVSVVHFHDGARNHWHAHAGGQVLHILTGSGQVQSWQGEVLVIEPGDTVAAEPGEKHWHGAAPGMDMAHVATSIGDITWMEPPPDR